MAGGSAGEGEEDGFVPPVPSPRWWLRAGVALVTVTALLLAGSYVYDRIVLQCADGVRRQGPQDVCVGVTDGGYVFDDPALADISHRIAEENRRVTRSGDPWVAVAYTEPLTRGPQDRGARAVREALQGAHLAQLELNDHSRGGRGSLPQIRLLPANSGPGGAQWKPLADQLVAMADGREGNLVGVIGFGQSTHTTTDLVDALRAARVPMVGATVAADDLTAAGEPGFFRVSSANADQTSAAARYLKQRQREDPGYRVAVIRDRRGGDHYNASLRKGFDRAAARQRLKVDMNGFSYSSDLPGVDNALSSIAGKICDRPRDDRPDAAFFAGRGPELRAFIQAAAAGGRRCAITVLSGSSAVGLYFGIRSDRAERARFSALWAASGVRVRYTAFTHPEVPAEVYAEADANPYPAFRAAYLAQPRFGGETGLRSGQAMQGHDALLVLGLAVRRAAADSGVDQVGPGSVLQMLDQVDTLGTVPGVSGPISFDDDGDPQDKPMALVEMDPRDDGAYRYVETLQP